MMKRFFVVFLAVALWSAPRLRADDSIPRGRWWSNPAVVERLKLTPQQQGSLDAVFQRHAPHLIDARSSVEKQALELRFALDRGASDRQLVERIVAQLNESRGRLFEREMMMLLDARQVLSDEQWQKVRRVMETRDRRPRAAGRRDAAGARPQRAPQRRQ